MTKLQYRGVSYDNASHEQPSPQPVDHAYRGQHYDAPLRHEAAPVDTEVELQYRGHAYHHRQAEAAQQVNQG
ncbi:DUF4278 domain-containing protein [Vulcanococcus sp. Clear-D1]|jgi:hypothetical protein|uniref:DUF4278 domain-containing protein n=1 Tax=Vulcanococcus sp. Clear-D1 TaxID=2766970 RepID=UPI0019C35299|nr:DUF4278 domain-containing protein [Vulcanococcus sp. Clear-D1]MBD1195432.1 DUF4278 domain-containing protein [Vulcanococcus sp. Clear-D1]